jgi:hypothetical protein
MNHGTRTGQRYPGTFSFGQRQGGRSVLARAAPVATGSQLGANPNAISLYREGTEFYSNQVSVHSFAMHKKFSMQIILTMQSRGGLDDAIKIA